MRFRSRLAALVAVPVLSAMGFPSVASAEVPVPLLADKEQVVGQYNVTFETVSNNCDRTGINLSSGPVTIRGTQSKSVDVSIKMLPTMKGTQRKGGKFRAKAKRGKTGIQGVLGQFSAAGHVEGNHIRFLLIGEYFAGKRPLCTQSWHAEGVRK